MDLFSSDCRVDLRTFLRRRPALGGLTVCGAKYIFSRVAEPGGAEDTFRDLFCVIGRLALSSFLFASSLVSSAL